MVKPMKPKFTKAIVSITLNEKFLDKLLIYNRKANPYIARIANHISREPS